MTDMPAVDRKALLTKRTLVLKVGSRSLATFPALYTNLATDIAELKRKGRRVLLVSSGAIALGARKLGFRTRPKEMAKLQAAAAAGQSVLMAAYEEAFAERGLTVAQVLLTHADLADRQRDNNARAALGALLESGAVPILNENDSVSVEEIKFGDNDQLASMVVPLVDADLLVLLSDVAGVLTATGQRLPVLRGIEEALPHLRASKSDVGTGGMASKLEAARRASLAGAHVVIADAREPNIVARIAAGEDVGTLVLPPAKRLSARKHWIAFTLRPRGALVLDRGAVSAVSERGKSLLPMGVLGVRGVFRAGDAVQLLDPDGQEIGRALVKLDALTALDLVGKRQPAGKTIARNNETAVEIVHRDDLVVWTPTPR